MNDKLSRIHPLANIRKAISKVFNLSQESLSIIIQWNKATLYRVEKGDLEMSKKLAKDLDNALGTHFLEHIESEKDIYDYEVNEEVVLEEFLNHFTDEEFDNRISEAFSKPPEIINPGFGKFVCMDKSDEEIKSFDEKLENFVKEKMYQFADQFKNALLENEIPIEYAEAMKYGAFAFINPNYPSLNEELLARMMYVCCMNEETAKIYQNEFLQFAKKITKKLKIDRELVKGLLETYEEELKSDSK